MSLPDWMLDEPIEAVRHEPGCSMNDPCHVCLRDWLDVELETADLASEQRRDGL